MSPVGLNASKTLYEKTINDLQIDYKKEHSREINPIATEYSFVTNNVKYTYLINEDYEVYIDTLQTVMEDINLDDLTPYSVPWYKTSEFGFITGVITTIVITSIIAKNSQPTTTR